MPAAAELTHSSSSPLGAFGLTPGGVVVCHDPKSRLSAIFADSEPAGMITLGGHPADFAADATCLFWKSVADLLIHRLCQIPDGTETLPDLPLPEAATLAEWTLNAPPMRGAEYLSPDVLLALWVRMVDWTRASITREKTITAFLQKHAPAWSRRSCHPASSGE